MRGLFNLFVLLGSCTFRSAQGVSGKGWHDDPITLGLSCKNSCFLFHYFFFTPTSLRVLMCACYIPAPSELFHGLLFCLATMETNTVSWTLTLLGVHFFFFLHLYLANDLIYYCSVLIHFPVHLSPLFFPAPSHPFFCCDDDNYSYFCHETRSSVHFLSYVFSVCHRVAFSFPFLSLV